MSFGENLANLRKQKGWSQDDLANNLNLSRQAISKWENNQSKPDVDNVQKISKAFGIKIDDLLDNDIPKEKAVTLEVKKAEKKEKAIVIVKLIIIAVIILYVISVVYKFASLLIIVNGVQKYANLDNYHYIITTYDENGLVEKEECWFKDGVSKTIATIFEGNEEVQQVSTCLDYNKKIGYVDNILENTNSTLNFDEYVSHYKGYEKGEQFYLNLPYDFRDNNILNIFIKTLDASNVDIKISGDKIYLKLQNMTILLNQKNILPILITYFNDKEYSNIYYLFESN